MGKPLILGRITFVHGSGRTGSGDIGKDGRYSLRAPVGDCKIAIESRELEPPPDPKKRKMVRPGMYIGKSFIPERYQNHLESGLTLKVQTGDNKGDFDLKP
jgi:hypothetical protein